MSGRQSSHFCRSQVAEKDHSFRINRVFDDLINWTLSSNMVTNKNAWYEGGETEEIPFVEAVPVVSFSSSSSSFVRQAGTVEHQDIPVLDDGSNMVPPTVEGELFELPAPPTFRCDAENEEEKKSLCSCQNTSRDRRKCSDCRKGRKEIKCQLKKEYKSLKKEAKKEWKSMKGASKLEAKAMKDNMKQEQRALQCSLRQSWKHMDGSAKEVREALKKEIKEEKQAVKEDTRLLKREVKAVAREKKREFRGMKRTIRDSMRGL